MTHDPLCQVQAWTPLERELDGNFYCQCALIAKVRADEREKAAKRVISLPSGANLSVAAAAAAGDVDAGVGW